MRRRSVSAAVRSDVSIDVYRAAEAKLAQAIDDPDTPRAVLPHLARELRQTRTLIDALMRIQAKGDSLDELAARREARLSSG